MFARAINVLEPGKIVYFWTVGKLKSEWFYIKEPNLIRSICAIKNHSKPRRSVNIPSFNRITCNEYSVQIIKRIR